MHKSWIAIATILFSFSVSAHAAADRQSFAGGGLGLEFLSKDGSGTGFYFQGMGGYNFTPIIGAGLHAGYSRVSSVNVHVVDFGGFLQATEQESGLYGKFFLDGVYASTEVRGHGITGSQVGFAPGIGGGLLIPSAGDFHMMPEVVYRLAFFDSAVNLITATFNVVWDF